MIATKRRHKWEWDNGSNPNMYESNWKQTCSACGAKRGYDIFAHRWNVGYIYEGIIEHLGIPRLIDKPWCDSKKEA